MSKKRKFVIHPYYGVIIVWLLVTIITFCMPRSTRVGEWNVEDYIIFGIIIFLYVGKYYVFSEQGIKVYLLGIRIRNIPWSNVNRLILFDDQSARRKKLHEHCIVVEKKNCNPPFPDEGSSWQSVMFFLKNPSHAVKIRLKPFKWEKQVDGIEEFHKIDEYITWEREDHFD